MNKVILLGNVGRDPKMRMVDSSTVAEFLSPLVSGAALAMPMAARWSCPSLPNGTIS